MKKITKRIISLILGLVILVGCIPSFTIDADAIEAERIELTCYKPELYVGEDSGLQVSFFPEGSFEHVTCVSSNENIVKYDDTLMRVIAVSIGMATITATSKSGLTSSVNVIVKERPELTGIEVQDIDGCVGMKEKINIYPLPRDAELGQLSFSSSDLSVASVDDDGIVSLNNEGEALITITAANGVCSTSKITVDTVTPMILDQKIILTSEDDSVYAETEWYSFTPEESGSYTFFLNTDQVDTLIYFISEDISSWAEIGTCDYQKYSCFLTAGRTCFIKTSVRGDGIVSHEFSVHRTTVPEYIKIKVADFSGYNSGLSIKDGMIQLHHGDTLMVHAQSFPDSSSNPRTTNFYSSDESIVKVENREFGVARLEIIGVGMATITVKDENGLSDSITVVVKPETIKEINIQAGLFGYPGKTDKIILDSYLTDDGEIKYSGDLDLTYESSNEDVVIVDDDGNVKFVGEGEASITAKTDTGISDSAVVYVGKKVEEGKVYKVNKDEDFQYFYFAPDVEGSYALCLESNDYYFSYSDVYFDSVASIGKFSYYDPLICSYQAGQARVYQLSACYESNYERFSCDGYFYIKKTVPAEGIDLNVRYGADAESTNDNFESFIGDELSLSPIFKPCNGTSNVTYSSSNEDVLKVEKYGSSAKVKCIGVGAAIITAKTDEGISTSINITVKERIFSFKKENINGLVGLSDELSIECVPYDYNNAIRNLTFISLDENIVKIKYAYSGSVNIEYMGLGSTRIICKYEGNVLASCDINVEEPTKISVDEIVNVDHATGRNFYEITPTVSGKYVINDNGNLENIYTVSNDGSLEKVDFTQNAGKTYVFFNSGKKYIICFDNSRVYEGYSFSVSGTIKASRISFEKEEMNVFYRYSDSTFSINIIFYPDNADYETVSLKSSDESVIEILDNGEIRSKKAGTAEITATTASGLTAKCTINVLDPINVTADNYIAVEYDSNVYGSYMVYSFVPDVSGKYKIYSIGNNLTAALMYDKGLNVVKYAESDETGGFLIEAELTAGTRYLICTMGVCNSDGLCNYVMRIASPGAHDFIIGDVNGDGVINPLDRLTLSRYLANWPDYTADKIDMDAADVNCDGVVNPLDRLILSRYLANWPEYNDIPHIK